VFYEKAGYIFFDYCVIPSLDYTMSNEKNYIKTGELSTAEG